MRTAMGSFLIALLGTAAPVQAQTPRQPHLGVRNTPILNVSGLQFKDLNRNGKLDVYEDWRKDASLRASDLVKRMTLEEKAGTMMHGSAPTADSPIGVGDHYDVKAAKEMIADKKVTSFITRLSGNPLVLADENNKLQQIAEEARLGVPATISSDPRNAIRSLLGASVRAGAFSKWPETVGLAAAGDPELVQRFGDIARQEYMAVGIRQALSPQVDLPTEPRWPRFSGTFGENPQLAKAFAHAYVAGMQHGEKGAGADSVLAVVKHWVGYGAAKDGWDAHNYYGRYSVYSGDNLENHIIPFEGAFSAHVSGVMPTYSILQNATLDGKPIEQVGGGFNRFLLTDLLRGRYKFDGVVMSDWLITEDCPEFCRNGAPDAASIIVGGMPWGVETLTKTQRFAKAANAGVNQFGGVVNSDLLVEAVKKGLVKQSIIDESTRLILEQKFALGIFEDPYVDPEKAKATVGSAAFQAVGDEAQRKSLVLLQNRADLLPLKPGAKLFLKGIEADAAIARGFQVVSRPEEADVSIVRAAPPSEELHPGYFFGSRHHEGRLNYRDGDEDYEALKAASAKSKTVMLMYLERPAILNNITDKAQAIVGHFGVMDGPLLDVLAGKYPIGGKLPFELPSSPEAVAQQRSDLPHDSKDPLFPFGFGLTYRR